MLPTQYFPRDLPGARVRRHMAGNEPIEVVETNALGTLLGNEATLALFLGVFVGFIGVFVFPVGGPAVSGAVTFLVVTGAILGAAVVNRTGKDVLFYGDRVELTKGTLGFAAYSADYDDVELVVRKTTNGDRLSGTETFELVRGARDNLHLRYLEDPDAAARILDERVAPPAEQLDASVGSSRRRHFWRHWPHDTEPPADPVVEDEELADALDVDAGDLELDALDQAEAHDDFSDLGDLGDVAGDIGGDAGGGFDGGDGGGGGGE